MLNLSKPYLYAGVLSLLVGGLGAWYYENVYTPKQDNIKKTKKIEELESNITLANINLDIRVDNALILQEHNQTDKKVKEIEDESFTDAYDFNSSNIFDGLFTFNAQRKD